MPGGYMLNGGYVAAALLFIAALFGVLVIGLAVGARAGRGSRPQLVLAWLLALLVPPWLLTLTASGDIFGVVLISRYALALPALAALWWLRRSIRAHRPAAGAGTAAAHTLATAGRGAAVQPPGLLVRSSLRLFVRYQRHHYFHGLYRRHGPVGGRMHLGLAQQHTLVKIGGSRFSGRGITALTAR
ncbi:hypothetical protein WJ972_10805 [Achromobacter insuavis]